jgi:calcineurin-like phosphoesterase family protein
VTTFFTSDTHFNHANILKYCPGRKYASIDAMNRDFIERWNARVLPWDIVWHLGDFALGSQEDAAAIFKALNGFEKHLILGNHDRTATQMRAMGWTSVAKGLTTPWRPDGMVLRLAHHPQTCERLDAMGVELQLCGHVHQSWSRANTRTAVDKMGRSYVKGQPDPKGRVLNVGVDARDFEPKTLREILDQAP